MSAFNLIQAPSSKIPSSKIPSSALDGIFNQKNSHTMQERQNAAEKQFARFNIEEAKRQEELKKSNISMFNGLNMRQPNRRINNGVATRKAAKPYTVGNIQNNRPVFNNTLNTPFIPLENKEATKAKENALAAKAKENALAAKAKEPIGYEIPPLESVLPESKILVNTNTFQNTRTDCDEKNPGRLASVHFHLGTRKWVIKHPSQKLKGKFFSKYYSGNTAEEAAQKYIKCNPDPYKNLNTEYINIEKVTTNKSTAASKLETAKKRMGYLQRTIKTGTSVTQNGKVKTKEDFQKELDELRKYGIPQLERNYKAARTVKGTTVKTSYGREKELQKRCYKVPMFGSFKPGVTKKSDNKNRSNCKQYYQRLGDTR